MPGSGSAITVTIDSTGLKIYGEGEWKVRKHGYSKGRTWHKLHLGCDPQSGFIHCCILTQNDVDDASQLDPLLDQVQDAIEDVCLERVGGFCELIFKSLSVLAKELKLNLAG